MIAGGSIRVKTEYFHGIIGDQQKRTRARQFKAAGAVPTRKRRRLTGTEPLTITPKSVRECLSHL